MPRLQKLYNIDEARHLFWQTVTGRSIPVEEVSVFQSAGRYLCEEIAATEFLPAFTRSSMDGYAVQAVDTRDASHESPLRLKIVGEVPMGGRPEVAIKSGEAMLIHTGGMLPEGADAVVILEVSTLISEIDLDVYKAVIPGENLILRGEDVQPGQVVLHPGKRIRPAEVGGMLALGKINVNVAKKTRVAVLSSGDEVIPPDQTPRYGEIRDINTGMISALIESEGGDVLHFPILPDNWEQMEQGIRQAFQVADALVISAGSSASTRDMTADVINSLGKPGVLVHGINIRPGKPAILGDCDGKPVVGLPGNPVSALVIAHFYVRPLVRWLQGGSEFEPAATVRAKIDEGYTSQSGRDEWVPVNLIQTESGTIARPILYKSNLIFHLASAEGLMYVPRDANGLQAGSDIEVVLI